MNWLLGAFGVLSALGGFGGIAAGIKVFLDRKKIGAEAKKLGVETDDLLSGRAIEMFREARKESQEAKQEAKDATGAVALCRTEVDSLRDHIDVLEKMMRDANPPLIPPAVPPRLYQIGGAP